MENQQELSAIEQSATKVDAETTDQTKQESLHEEESSVVHNDEEEANPNDNEVLVPEQNLIESRIDLSDEQTAQSDLNLTPSVSVTESAVFLTQSQISYAQTQQQQDQVIAESVVIEKSDLESQLNLLDNGEIELTKEQQQQQQASDSNNDEEKIELLNLSSTNSRVTPVDEVERMVKNDYEHVSRSQIEEAIDREIESKYDQLNKSSIDSSSQGAPPRRLEDEQFVQILGNESLQKRIVQYGDQGDASRPINGQMVTISFEAYVHESDKLVDHNENLSFILGDGDVLSGLDMAVCLMDRNEKAEILIEARHGYGAVGKLPDIPLNATLFFKVHLKSFTDLTELNLMRPVERLSLAEAKKLRGNFHYNRQDFHWAVISYKKGLDYLKEENLRGDEEPTDMEKFLELTQSLRMNLALSYFKMAECREALNMLNQVLEAQPKHIKALYIKGKVLIQTGETEEAIKTLNKSLQLDPANTEVKKELAKAQTMHKVQYENEKRMYQKMISAVSKTEEDMDKIKNKRNKGRKESNSYLGYIAAGLFVAAASVGVALFARSKNMI